jgi:hypothetical protein
MVREQLRALQEQIDSIRELPRTEAEKLREELRLKVVEATRDSIRRDDEIHTLIGERTRAAIAERRRARG